VCIGAVTAAVCAAISWRCGLALGLSEPAAALLGVTVLLLPSAGYDVVDNLVNVQWFVICAMVVFFAAWIYDFRPNIVLTGVLLAVGGLTTPLAIFCAPVVAVVTLIRRRRYDLAVLVTVTVTSAIQLAPTVFGYDRVPSSSGNAHLRLLVNWFPYRIVAGAFLGVRLLRWYYATVGLLGIGVVGAVIVAWLVTFMLRSRGAQLGVCFFLLGEAVILYFVPLALRGYSYAGNPIYVDAHGRYMAAPAICIFLTALIAVDGWARRTRWSYSSAVAGGLLGFVVLALALNFSIDLHRLPRSTFDAEVRREQAACAANAPHVVVVGIAPDPSTWRIVASCRQAFP
jgi:hypothetical protein